MLGTRLLAELNCGLVVTTAGVAAATTSVSGERVFMAAIVARVSYVALTITGLVAVEVVEPLLAALGQRSVVAVVGIVAVVDVAVEAMMTVKPRARPDEDTAYKPVRAVVAVGGAIVRSVVEVAVGANGRYSDVDSNLGVPKGCTTQQGNCQS
jgi:hypothetical protein